MAVKLRHLNFPSLSDDNVLVDYKPKRKVKNLIFASSDDAVTVNGEFQSPGSDTDATDLEKMRVKLNRPLVDDVDFCDDLLQSLYDAARVFELEIKEQNSLSRVSLFSIVRSRPKCVGKDTVISGCCVLLIASCNLLRLSALLESLIREKVSVKQPKAYDWFWSKQVPAVVASFIKKFEGSEKNMSGGLSCTSEVSLLMLALTCNMYCCNH
ncbi:LETM1 protein [Trifolium repens]|nr:LETM1 protein [Trifolium repens]